MLCLICFFYLSKTLRCLLRLDMDIDMEVDMDIDMDIDMSRHLTRNKKKPSRECRQKNTTKTDKLNEKYKCVNRQCHNSHGQLVPAIRAVCIYYDVKHKHKKMVIIILLMKNRMLQLLVWL